MKVHKVMKTKLMKIVSRNSIFPTVGLLFNIFLLYTFLSLWICPQVDDVEMIVNLSVLMVFEFFMINTRFFMVVFSKSKLHGLWGLLFVLSYVIMFNRMVSNNLILILYSAMVLNRMLSVILSKGKTDIDHELNILAQNLTIYIILLVVVSCCITIIPQFGMDNDFLKATNFRFTTRRSVEDGLLNIPHIAMCFGVLYYLTLTIVDIIPIIRMVKSSSSD